MKKKNTAPIKYCIKSSRLQAQTMKFQFYNQYPKFQSLEKFLYTVTFVSECIKNGLLELAGNMHAPSKIANYC